MGEKERRAGPADGRAKIGAAASTRGRRTSAGSSGNDGRASSAGLVRIGGPRGQKAVLISPG
jgi:hypothetical protein